MRITNVARILAIVGFITLAVATSKIGALKQKLADVESSEITKDNVLPTPTLLAQVGSAHECDDECDADGCGCDCDLDLSCFHPCLHPKVCPISPPCVEGGDCHKFPNELGVSTATERFIDLESSNKLAIQVTPDRRLIHKEETKGSANEESIKESLSKGCKFRHFCIKGDIVVSESVTFKQDEIEDERSVANAAQTTVSVEAE
jgi:hypothetical protein